MLQVCCLTDKSALLSKICFPCRIGVINLLEEREAIPHNEPGVIRGGHNLRAAHGERYLREALHKRRRLLILRALRFCNITHKQTTFMM